MDICFNMDAKRRGGQEARVNPAEYRSTVVRIMISVDAEIELIGERALQPSSLSSRGIDTSFPRLPIVNLLDAPFDRVRF